MDEHHSRVSLVCLKIEKICGSGVARFSRKESARVGAKVSDGLNDCWTRREDRDFVHGIVVEMVLGEPGGRDESAHVCVEGRSCDAQAPDCLGSFDASRCGRCDAGGR